MKAGMMDDKIVEIHGAAEIAQRVTDIAAEIAAAHGEREVTMLGVLEDGFVFLSDLLRAMRTPLRTSFLRYKHIDLGGVQDITFKTETDVTGRAVVLVEGVLDTGVTQEYIIKQLEARGAASIRLCVLVDKPDGRRTSITPDWRAFETHEEYVVGYGLGFQERWRELPFLATRVHGATATKA